MYIFGGIGDGSINSKLFNDMIDLNTVDLSLSTLNQPTAPTPRAGYSATLLSNGVIVYIGGLELGNGNTFQTPDIAQIVIFNTNTLSWSTAVCTNKSTKDYDQSIFYF